MPTNAIYFPFQGQVAYFTTEAAALRFCVIETETAHFFAPKVAKFRENYACGIVISGQDCDFWIEIPIFANKNKKASHNSHV